MDEVDTWTVTVTIGEHDGHTFIDYANRDEDTGQIKQGSKAWSIFEACLGRDFHKRPDVSLESLVGKQFMAPIDEGLQGLVTELDCAHATR